MTDRKISELVAVTTVEDADEFVVARAGASNKITGANLKAAAGGAVTTREEWSGTSVAVSPNTFEWLTWNSSGGPDALLDATIPAHPVVVTAGVYVVSVVVGNSGAPDSYFDVGLYLDRQGFNASQTARTIAFQCFALDGVAADVNLAFAWYIPAGGAVEVGVEYFADNVTIATCSLRTAHLQRVS